MSKKNSEIIWINYLRTLITILVVLHHSALAYTTFSKFDKKIYINSTHPVVDNQNHIGIDILVNFNDIYFMSLMFLIGGLFLIKSIDKKGMKRFINDRILRLLIPFLLLGTLFMLIAYFPSYYLVNQNFNLSNYIIDYFTIQKWPVGPPWFLWLLFLFNFLFAITYTSARSLYSKIGKKIDEYSNKPYTSIAILIFITAILYIPITYHLGSNKWTGVGPFDFQLNRIFLYLGYFLIGVIIGETNFNNKLFGKESKIVIMWKWWVIMAIIVFLILTISPSYLTRLVVQYGVNDFYTWMIYYMVYVLSCCLSCVALITSLRVITNNSSRLWDNLSENAYMIYLIHYIFIIWIQFFLLEISLNSYMKLTLTFVLAMILSYYTSIGIRKIKFIGRYI